MNHEPECDLRHDRAEIGCSVCDASVAAYQRGREDAAQAVGAIKTWPDESTDFAEFPVCDHVEAMQAARGESRV